jgi:hypothetical protein
VVLLALELHFLGANPVGIAVLLVLLVCIWLFWALSVQVTESEIVLWFGSGSVRRRFALSSVADARVVRNKWYFGWGIRVLPKGRLYNVSGLDAVEIEMRDGSVHRIGTDRPSELLMAIRDACGMARQHLRGAGLFPE